MIQIVLHVGPHKTGTTSVQHYLRGSYGAEKPRGPIWYPRPAERGPGHAALAFNVLEGDGVLLRSIVRTAAASGVRKLVLSSENFSGAYPDRIEKLGAILSDHCVTLIVTLNSPIRRAASTWQELLKHGHNLPFASSIERILRAPGYQHNFVETFAKVLRPLSTAVVLISKEDAATELILKVAAAGGLPDPNGRHYLFSNPREWFLQIAATTGLFNAERPFDFVANPRVGLAEAEILLAMNQFLRRSAPDMPHSTKVILVNSLMRAFWTKDWQSHCPRVQIATPPELLTALRKIARRTFDAISSPKQGLAVTLYGNPKCILEEPDLH